MLLLAFVLSSLCVGADAGDLWYKRGRRERPGVPLWKPPDATPVVVETPAPTEDTTPAPRMEGIEAIDNVDIEAPGALEKALAARARASDKELIVMAVGDTRDHRRMHKDPALSQISVDFAVNLVENLAALGLRNYLMLTSSAKLCDELRRDAQIDGCVHSSHLIDHPKLELWNVKPGDMFLLWAQQWRVVRRALQSGYSVMRVDSDVVFLEDPYLALHGPLLSPYAMVSQTDVFNLGTRPKCEADADLAPETNHPGVARCGLKRLDPNGEEIKTQLNIGLTYFRRSAMSDDGPVLGVLNDMLSAFETKLGGEVAVDDEGNAITEALLDQPMFRAAVAVRAAAKRRVEGRERRGRRRVRRRGVPAFPGDLRGDQRAKSEGGHLLRRRQSTHFPQGRHAQRAHRRRPGLALRPGMREDRVGRQIRAVAPSIADTERRRKNRDVRLEHPRGRQPRPGGQRRRFGPRRGSHGVQQGSQTTGRDGGDGVVARARPRPGFRTRYTEPQRVGGDGIC